MESKPLGDGVGLAAGLQGKFCLVDWGGPAVFGSHWLFDQEKPKGTGAQEAAGNKYQIFHQWWKEISQCADWHL